MLVGFTSLCYKVYCHLSVENFSLDELTFSDRKKNPFPQENVQIFSLTENFNFIYCNDLYCFSTYDEAFP